MNNSNIPCYVRSNIEGHNITAHIWVYPSLTEVECEVLELLVKGYSVTRISESRFRSVKTVSLQKHQIYKKLGIRNDITFWLDLSLSSCVKMKFTYKEGTVKESPLSCLNNVSNIAHNISCKNPQQE
ncbi:helix-turn-helix domain-containing protein [Escherichia coli]|jgi:Response regulator containing a CheY-like receiver domain and an HTH DNA-binding domain|uniref:Response regulator transcription factor n=4 Tax=Escherichia coli TaxID=562 RepID=A0A6L6SES3_ECOLX|nr:MULTISPECIES: LuxR C-terminal-related transcriptional regulator [Enterobacteriaceae]EEZ6105083.1 response regulator transcription factor [Escherichia coli O86]EFA4185204.1 response regulator transcription factor [Escherichia coli O86:H8]EFA4223924.1 response regulator transcription factor [Escherichia coli O151:H8]EFN6769168.1 response regulator transcription factor [Escherichia coli O39:H21]EFN8538792.1 DNA-binding response regulator [Escherichia coli O117]EFN8571043.1 DNA-binding respons